MGSKISILKTKLRFLFRPKKKKKITSVITYITKYFIYLHAPITFIDFKNKYTFLCKNTSSLSIINDEFILDWSQPIKLYKSNPSIHTRTKNENICTNYKRIS